MENPYRIYATSSNSALHSETDVSTTPKLQDILIDMGLPLEKIEAEKENGRNYL